jgi:hypothetical protein
MPILKGAEAARVLKAVGRFERQPTGNRVSLQPRRHVTAQGTSGVFIGKADGDIAKGSSGTVSVWAGTPGGESDTGTNIANCYNRAVDISTGQWVTVMFVNGFPYVVPLECES